MIPWKSHLAFRTHNVGRLGKYGILVCMVWGHHGICKQYANLLCWGKTLESQQNKQFFSVLQNNLDLWPNMYQDYYCSRVTIPLSRSNKVCGKIRVCTRFPANLFRKGTKLKTAPPGSITLPLEKREWNENGTHCPQCYNARQNEQVCGKDKNIICITECNRYMTEVTEQPVISCITPFSEKQWNGANKFYHGL